MNNNELVKYEGELIKRVCNAIGVTNKLLGLTRAESSSYIRSLHSKYNAKI